jgi:MbtH protein
VETDREEPRALVVVVNDEGQYAMWPAGREIPAGWAHAGMEGTRDECATFVESVWSDITPRSLRARETHSGG